MYRVMGQDLSKGTGAYQPGAPQAAPANGATGGANIGEMLLGGVGNVIEGVSSGFGGWLYGTGQPGSQSGAGLAYPEPEQELYQAPPPRSSSMGPILAVVGIAAAVGFVWLLVKK